MTVLAFPQRPRGAPIDSDVPLCVVPALAALANCSSSTDAMSVFLELPDQLLPAVTFYASKRSHIHPSIMRSLIQITTIPRLREALGPVATRNIVNRFYN